METLTDKQIQSLHQGIQQLYTLCDLDTFRVNVLSIVDRLVPSKVPVFHLTNMRTYQIEDTFLPDHPGLSSEWQNIESLYLDEHPITQNISDALTGACKISDFVSQKEFHFDRRRNEYWYQYRPQTSGKYLSQIGRTKPHGSDRASVGKVRINGLGL